MKLFEGLVKSDLRAEGFPVRLT
ncbi:hypothetical protein RCCS2_07729 [Roseobacter sp. CCS2]|nr:hypothetical protein RCCS2_07729 [Roseobacter sp. CCS2]